jgi:hypothetical protein
MKIEISKGELLDKFSILEIKAAKIKDENKLKNIYYELEIIKPYVNAILLDNRVRDLYFQLKLTNEDLWKIEDDIRQKERDHIFNEEFIRLARSVYFTNDFRADIKKKINIFSKSALIEEKSYEKY